LRNVSPACPGRTLIAAAGTLRCRVSTEAMKSAMGGLMLLPALFSSPGAAAGVTPIAKVTQLLTDMYNKGVAEKEEEAKKYSAFQQWCGDTDKSKAAEIQAAADKIEMHDAEIQKAEAQIRDHTSRINELNEDVGRWKRDQTSASDVRGKEREDFQATQQDYSESLDALDNAIAVLKKQNFDRPQAEMLQVKKSLLQLSNLQLVPLAQKKALAAFLQQPTVEEMPDEYLSSKKNPEAHGYEFQSGGVIEMLEKLKDQFGSKKYELEKEELNAKHAFEQLFQQLTDNIENANHEVSKKSILRAETQKYKAEHEGDRAQTASDKAEDEKYHSEMKALCQVKASDFENRQKLRGEELEAIKQAIDILSSDQVAGAGEKHLPSLLQKRRSFAQLRAGQTSPIQSRIATFLSARAKSIDSKLLSLVSQRVATDPFVKVKKLIKDLIVKLMEEATAETEHKGWCDAELATNKVSREAKTEDVEKLTAHVEDLTTTIAELTSDIADLSSAVQELTKAMGEAKAERAASSEKNQQTIQEAKDAQVAITQATALLKDFYAKSAEATSLIQEKKQAPEEDAPETFSSPYKGMLPESGNVISFLEVILADFARLESDTTTAEDMEIDEHKKFIFESEKDKALKENEIEHKTATRTEKEGELTSTKEELKVTQDALDKAVAYYEKLKPTCVDSGVTYEERVKRREEEIQSLQEALQILAGTDVSLP